MCISHTGYHTQAINFPILVYRLLALTVASSPAITCLFLRYLYRDDWGLIDLSKIITELQS